MNARLVLLVCALAIWAGVVIAQAALSPTAALLIGG